MAEPVQTPVVGRGTATKIKRPSRLYFLTVWPFLWALASTQWAKGLNNFVDFRKAITGFRKYNRKGTGSREPK